MPSWLNQLDRLYPVRYSAWLVCLTGALAGTAGWAFGFNGPVIPLVFALLSGVGLMDTLQTRRSVLRNYPVIGQIGRAHV